MARKPPSLPRRFPAEPMLRALADLGLSDGTQPSLRRSIVRCRKTGTVTVAVADEICVRVLGAHPIELWPDLWVTP